MKRRDFLKSATATSLAAAGSLAGCNDARPTVEYAAPPGRPEELAHIEDAQLAVTIFTDAVMRITDKVNEQMWKTSPVAIQEEGPIDLGHVWTRTSRSFCEQYPGRFVAKKQGNHIHLTLLGRQNRVVGTVVIDIQLQSGWLVCRILEVSESLPSLIFPPPVICDSLVIPNGAGLWLRKPPSNTRFDRKFYPFFSNLNMRWFGGIKEDACWLAILDEGMPDSGAFRSNRSISPVWLKSLGKWKPPFSVRFRFDKGNYVTLAKIFRKWAMQNKLFKSLDEKIDTNPNLRHFVGGRMLSFYEAWPGTTQRQAEDLWLPRGRKLWGLGGKDEKMNIRFTHADVIKHIEKAKSLGFKKGPVIVRGWINGGYDASHPDIWPPEPALGDIDEMRQIMSLPEPIVAGLHDNYQDMYARGDSFPKGVCIMHDGRLMPAGFWPGGQAYAVGGRDQLRYAKRNWKDIKTLGPKAIFVDTTTAMQMYQSYEKGNELRRIDDRENKYAMLKFYRDQGALIGSEEIADYGAPVIDWFENRNERIEGEYVPLWPLVYHDAAICTRYRPRSITGTGTFPNWLEDMLWGYMLLFHIDSQWRGAEEFRNSFEVDAWHERVATAEMTNHKFLTEDYKVEQTEFSTGDSIIVNFSDKPVTIEGTTIQAQSYSIIT